MRESTRVIVSRFCAALSLVTVFPISSFAQGGSRLPPSNPEAAVRVGTLDEVRPNPPSPTQMLPCFGFNVVLNQLPAYRTAWFNFSLASKKTKLDIKMIETPD